MNPWKSWCLDVQDAALTLARAVDRTERWLLQRLIGCQRVEQLLEHRRLEPGFYAECLENRVSWAPSPSRFLGGEAGQGIPCASTLARSAAASQPSSGS